MAYPYVSGGNNIIKIIAQLRNNFPANIDVDMVKRYMIAPKGESYIVGLLKFLDLIDDDGNRSSENRNIFLNSDDDFQAGFAKIIKKAYAKLFDAYGEGAWQLDDAKLSVFFRQEDEATISVGKNKAMVFRVLAGIAGKRETKATAQVKLSVPTKTNKPKQATPKINAPKSAPITTPTEKLQLTPSGNFALSVRIEVNLPSDGTKETYDNIFKSIRENLINE